MMEKAVLIYGKKVHYKTAGSGLPVVLLHGFAEDGSVWKYQQDELAKHCLLIVPDLPGSGKSEMIGDMSLEGLAGCIKDLVANELPEEKMNPGIIMIGHSMGGYIALAFAEKYPALLLGLGLFHSSAFQDNEEKIATRRRGITFIQKHGSYEFIKQSAPNLFADAYRIKNSGLITEMMERYSSFDPQAMVAYYMAMITRPNRIAVLQSFNKPVLFIIGKNDKAIPFEDSLKQCCLPPTSAVFILEQSAHMGMWEEQQKSTLALLTFLQVVAVN